MGGSRARPVIGQYIEHREPGFGRNTRGIVMQLLSEQFTYLCPEGDMRAALYREDWAMSRPTAKEVQVEAPSVWRSHQSRTCLVLHAEDGGVRYIPMVSDVPFDVHKTKEANFTQTYLEAIDYPVEQAARLILQYARHNGATDEALDHLALHTEATEEDFTMARKAAAASKAAGGTSAPKTTKAAKAAGERKPSAASRFRELIMRGTLSDGKIFEKVQSEFGLDDSKRNYVNFYRNQLKKRGENPPEPKGGAKKKRSAKPKDDEAAGE